MNPARLRHLSLDELFCLTVTAEAAVGVELARRWVAGDIELIEITEAKRGN